MRNRIMGERRFNKILSGEDTYIIVAKNGSNNVGDIIRLVEIGNITNAQTGRFVSVTVTGKEQTAGLIPDPDRETLVIKRLPIFCPNATVEDFWPTGTCSCKTPDRCHEMTSPAR